MRMPSRGEAAAALALFVAGCGGASAGTGSGPSAHESRSPVAATSSPNPGRSEAPKAANCGNAVTYAGTLSCMINTVGSMYRAAPASERGSITSKERVLSVKLRGVTIQLITVPERTGVVVSESDGKDAVTVTAQFNPQGLTLQNGTRAVDTECLGGPSGDSSTDQTQLLGQSAEDLTLTGSAGTQATNPTEAASIASSQLSTALTIIQMAQGGSPFQTPEALLTLNHGCPMPAAA